MTAVWVLVTGNLNIGFTFYGPFDTVELAADYATLGDEEWTVVQLVPPEIEVEEVG